MLHTGGYSGKTTAGISGVFIFFTSIGYCGAHHQKAYFLILYSFIILLFLGGNVVVAFIAPSITLLHPATKQFFIMATIMLIVMGLACFLAWQVKHEIPDEEEDTNQRNSSVNSSNMPSSQQQQQLANQTISQQQQQQQPNAQQPQQQTVQQIQLPPPPLQSQQSPSNTITNTANGTHHYQQPSLSAHFHNAQLLNNNNNCIPPNQPITMTVKQQNGYPTLNPNVFYKPANLHQQMPGVFVQLPAVPPRYSQQNNYS